MTLARDDGGNVAGGGERGDTGGREARRTLDLGESW